MFFVFIVLFVFISCSTEAEKPEYIFARVGEKTLTKEDVVEMKKRGLVSEGSVSNLVNRWVEKTLLYEASKNLKLDKDETLLKKRNVFYKNLLISSFLDIKAKKEISVSKKEISNYYNKNKKSFARNSDEILLKHFVLPTNKEAKKVKRFLKSNKKGKELALMFERCCVNDVLSLLHGRIYHCPFSANAHNLEAIPIDKTDWIDLSETKNPMDLRLAISKFYFGKAFQSACKYCLGRDFEQPKVIPALQTKKPIDIPIVFSA